MPWNQFQCEYLKTAQSQTFKTDKTEQSRILTLLKTDQLYPVPCWEHFQSFLFFDFH